MKIKLLITMLFALCGLSTFAAVTGETPTTGKSYLIYNVGQQKYLTVSGSTVSLSTSGTQFTVAAGTTTGCYTLTATNKLSSTFLGDIICSDNGYYTDWKFSLLSSTDKTYALGILENEDAYSFSYMYYSSVLSSIQKSPFMPDFTNGEWMFVTSTTPTEITYTLGKVEAIADMEYTATTATVKYTVNASDGSVYNCTKDVTFAANDTYEAVTRSGEFTDATYKVTVPWSVKLGAKPVTYSLGSVEALPDMNCDATSATVKYTIHPSYGTDISCTHEVTFDPNDTYSEVTRSGEFTDATYNVAVTWSVKLAAKTVPTITYTLGSVDPIADKDYTATSATVTYTIHPSSGSDISCTHEVTFDANDTYSEVERSGEFTDATYDVVVPWSVKLGAKPTEKVTKVTFYQNSETITIPDNLADYVDVYLYRSPMAAKKKSSFCVPFDMTYTQLKAAFGNGLMLYSYRTYSSKYNKLYYATEGNILAGVPYIVVPDATAAESEEETAAREANTELTDTEARLYIIKGVKSSTFVTEPGQVTHGAYTYYSNLVDQTVPATFYTFDETTGDLKRANTAREMKGFRAYFASTDASVKVLTEICFDDDWSTSIDEIDAEEPLTIYNVNGQLVRKDVKNTDGLAKGVYIVNGKKVMIK